MEAHLHRNQGNDNEQKFHFRVEVEELLEADVDKLNRHTHQGFLLAFDFEGLMEESEVALLAERAKPHLEVIYFKDNSGRCLFQQT